MKRTCETCERQGCMMRSPTVVDCCTHKPKPQTNADRYRAMSDEELAWITVREIKVWNYVEGYYDTEYKCSDGYVTDDYREAIDHEVDWLKQPVKDGEDDA